jgi:hypothetical protein
MNPLPILLVTAILLASAGFGCAQADAIHKWVDARGVTHYSDRPPATAAIQTTQLDIDTGRDSAASSTGNPDDYYSIANQWQRMSQEGLQRRQFELQRAAISASIENRKKPAPVEAESKRYVGIYYQRRYHRRGYRHGHHGTRPGQHKKPSGFPTVLKQSGTRG